MFTLHKGPKLAIITAAVLILAGNWIRYIGARLALFPVVMTGQILIGFAQPFVLIAPTRYSDLWFSDKGRTTATAIASLANPFGGAVSYIWICYINGSELIRTSSANSLLQSGYQPDHQTKSPL